MCSATTAGSAVVSWLVMDDVSLGLGPTLVAG